MIHQNTLSEYNRLFVQRLPRFGEKTNDWRTVHRNLKDTDIVDHLEGRRTIGMLAPWYTSYGVIDIDDRPERDVHEIVDLFGLNGKSLIFNSESRNSYHVLFRPTYNDKAPTAKLLKNATVELRKFANVEVYPQMSKVLRAPLGISQKPFRSDLKSLEDKVRAFKQLEELKLEDTFQTASALVTQQTTDLDGYSESWWSEGNSLLKTGLVYSNSRWDSQFKVLYVLWRKNLCEKDAVDFVESWLNLKSNGLSKDLIYRSDKVRSEIELQAELIWHHFEVAGTLPDDPSAQYEGWLSKEQIVSAIQATQGSWKHAKFLFKLLAYYNPRADRRYLNVSQKTLQTWASRNGYLNYLNTLDERGILTRSGKYATGRFSKSIELHLSPARYTDAVMYNGRVADTELSLLSLFSQDSLRDLLISSGSSKQAAHYVAKSLFS